jgi:hypothetical protein
MTADNVNHEVGFGNGPLAENRAELLRVLMQEIKPSEPMQPSLDTPEYVGYMPCSVHDALESVELAEENLRVACLGTDTPFRRLAEHRLEVAKAELAAYRAKQLQIIDKWCIFCYSIDMSNHEHTPGPEHYDVEYSGAQYGDARDPKTIGEIMPAIDVEIRRREEYAALLEARSRVINLEKMAAQDPTSVTEEELRTAKMSLVVQEGLQSMLDLSRRAD